MESNVTELYRLRFQNEIDARDKIWKVLVGDYFQKYVSPSYSVCDLGAGYCEFINNIKSKNSK